VPHRIETDRLILRSPESGDADALATALNSPEIAKATLAIPHPYTIDHARAFINKSLNPAPDDTDLRIVVIHKESGDLIGGVSLDNFHPVFRSAEIGYWIAPGYWGNNYAPEAAVALIQFGFDTLGLNRIYARCPVANPSSIRVIEKAGMKWEGTARGEMMKDDVAYDVDHYAILKSDWDERESHEILSPSIRIETDRMILRPPCYSDLPHIIEPINDPVISANSAHVPHPYTMDDAREWYFRQWRAYHEWDHVTLLMFLQETDELVGSIWYRSHLRHKKAGMAYWVARKHWNKGLATEACRAMIRYGFEELGLERIEANIIINNEASVRVAEKLGMTRESIAYREWWRDGTIPLHCYHYSLLKED